MVMFVSAPEEENVPLTCSSTEYDYYYSTLMRRVLIIWFGARE